MLLGEIEKEEKTGGNGNGSGEMGWGEGRKIMGGMGGGVGG